MPDFRKQLLAAFDIEHREHLSAIRQALAQAREGRTVDLKDAFRRAHSLKGAARAVDLAPVEELAHRIEALFAETLEGRRTLDRQAISAIELALDRIEGVSAAQQAGGEAPDIATAVEAIQALDARTAEPASPPAEPEKPARKPAKKAVAVETVPEPVGGAAEEPVEFLRVAASQVERLSATSHQLATEISARRAIAEEIALLEREARALTREVEALQRRAADLAAVDGTGGTAGILGNGLRDLDRSAQGFSRRLTGMRRNQRRMDWGLDQAASRVREEIDRVGLVPVEAVFGGFASMARELGRGAGREIEVRTSGFMLHADRRVLQALKDPILHILRNAVGHGIEAPAERARLGKPQAGEIGIDCTTRGARLRIAVTDDGRGPDLERIERVATERGLIGRSRQRVPRDRLYSMVFEPGFSTAEAVDHLSGRGMGLSVVAEAIRALHGSVLMRPQYPHGTEIVISVPLTLARQPVLIVGSGEETFAIPSYSIERLLRIPQSALESAEGRPVVRIEIEGQDVVVPVIPLAYFMTSTDTTIPAEAGHVRAVLLHRAGRRCALAVDALEDVRSLIVEEIAGIAYDRALVTGVVMVEADRPAPVVNPDAIIERWLDAEDALAASGVGIDERQTSAERHRTTILVVDDSITTRTLEKSILEAQGFRVLLSVDGLDALTTLRSGQAMIDLVLADVEMPNMDGFGLLQAIKADASLARLPVILMTSRAAPDDVRRGLDLGASAYLTKQKFDQRELLATIGQLL